MCRLLALVTMLGSGSVVAEDPQVAYWLHCAGCHRLGGESAPPEVPTLIDEPGFIASLPGGREYLIRIPGVALAGLPDDRLAEVLNFMLQQFSPDSVGAGFEPYSAEEVARHREQVLLDPLKRRAEILAAAEPRG